MKYLYAAVIIGSLGMTMPVTHAAQESYVYTSTHGSACSGRSREGVNQWRCPGPGGYVAEYADEGNVVGIAIWQPATRRVSPRAVSWPGAGRVFGEKLEWRLKNGQPHAAILRIWRLATDAGGNDRELEELIIIKIAPSGACRVAAINARQPRANSIAQQTADGAAAKPCQDDP
jgi:hypothetical protein